MSKESPTDEIEPRTYRSLGDGRINCTQPSFSATLFLRS